MNNNALATPDKPHSIAPAMTAEQVDLIKRTVCKGATNDELALFLHTAKRTGLDPLARQIHAVKRGGVMAVQTGIDGYRLIADRTGNYAPGDVEVTMDAANKLPVSAKASVKKKVGGEWHTVTATAYWSEYAVENSPMWRKMPRLMLGKCAEALALRRAFPAELSGLYTVEEMEQATDAPINATPAIKAPEAVPPTVAKAFPTAKVREEAVEAEVVEPTPKATAPSVTPKANPAKAGEVISEKQGVRLYAIWKQAGKSTEEVKAYLKEKYGLTATRDIKRGDYEAIVEWCQGKTAEPTTQAEDGPVAEMGDDEVFS